VIHIVRVGDAKIGIEAITLRESFRVVPKVPFAEAGGGVSLIFQVISNGMFFGVEAFLRGGKEDVLVHADPLWIAASEKGSARGGTDRGSDHEVRKFAAFFREAVDVGCFDFGGAKAAEIAVTLIIGEDNYKVGLFCSACGEAFEGEDQKKEDFHLWFGCSVLRVSKGRFCERLKTFAGPGVPEKVHFFKSGNFGRSDDSES
jgi:hypothetical protein